MQLNRFTASGVHIAISAIIAVSILLGMKSIWYPDPYFEVIDAGRLILILVGVDIVIGPLITLIVFNRNKPELKRDMLIVALLQSVALVYGIYIVFMARPVYAVFNVDRFDVVTAAEIDPAELRKVQRGEFKAFPWFGPQIIGAQLPSSIEEKKRILFSSVSGGADVYQLPQYYVPYAEMKEIVKDKAKPLAMLRKKVSSASLLDKFIAENGHRETELGFVPFHGRKKDYVAVLELATGTIIGYLPIDGF